MRLFGDGDYRSWGVGLELAGVVRVGGAIAFSQCLTLTLFGSRAFAQIAPDTTLGAESSVFFPFTPDVDAIAGGAIRGANLLHSFSEFNIPEGRGAYFFSPTEAIQNILARVTGGTRSEIFGVLGTFGNSQPNLFLINPNGILFGPNAELDVGGSFVASTAESVVFDNGFAFSATNPQAPPILTINTPIGLQYGSNPGNIVNQSVFGLEVQPGKTLALVGGDVAIEGGILSVTDGRIELGSVAGNNRVNLTPTNTGYALDYESVEDFQDINLTQAAVVNASGDSGGSIHLQGRNVTLTDGSRIGVVTLGSGRGGSLRVNASGLVQLIGTTPDGQFETGLFATTRGAGKAGDVRLTAGQLLIRDGALISASTFGEGDGGSLIVEVSDSVQLIGTTPDSQFPSGLFATTGGAGKAGDVRLTARQLLIRDGAAISASTFGEGESGNLIVEVSGSVQLIGFAPSRRFPSGVFATTQGAGKAGDVRLTAGQLLVQDGAVISASTASEGEGGNLVVEVSDWVHLIGTAPNGRSPSGIGVNATGAGNAGELRFTAGQLLVRDGATISANTVAEGDGGNLIIEVSDWVHLIGTVPSGQFVSGVLAVTRGAGKAGDVSLTAGQLLVQDGAVVSVSTFGAGAGGSLIVEVSDSVQLIGTAPNGRFASGVFASTQGVGKAGDVRLTTDQLLVRDGALISTSTFGAGAGGSLIVEVSELVQLIGTDLRSQSPSGIAAQTRGADKAGDVRVTAGQLLILDGAGISASTLGEGEGGSVIVEVSDWVQLIGTAPNGLGSSIVAQTAGAGKAGNVRLTAEQLLILDGAAISASTFGEADGGNLVVEVSDLVQLSEAGSLSVDALAGGTAGDLTLKTSQLSIEDGSQVTVSSPEGQAGNLTITADSLLLNQGNITAVTGTSGSQGGANITLQGLDLLLIGNESLISASALNQANGGNVTIDSTFIVATPPEGSQGSDITANAVRGNGGRVNVTTQGLFDIQFRSQRTPDNDITVSSEFGIAGEFTLNQPGVDPSRGLAQLPGNLVDAEGQIDRTCTSGGAAQTSSFVVTGRGGIPPSPLDPLDSDAVVSKWVTLDSEEENTNSAETEGNTTTATRDRIVEAQGWVKTADGQVILVAQAPTVTLSNPSSISLSCQTVQAATR